MSEVECGRCGKQITEQMEAEYSKWIGDYYCSSNCAMDEYFDRMGSSHFIVQERKNELEERGLVIKNGKLYYRES